MRLYVAPLVLFVLSTACSSPKLAPKTPAEHEESASFSAPLLPAEPEAPPSRPRLSHTITLGESYATSPGPYALSSPGFYPGGTSIVINNQVNVASPMPAYYGGGYYGGYVVGGRGAAPVVSTPAIARPSTGWGGPGTPTPAGHTPSVAGDWKPPTSYGPNRLQ